MKRLLGIVHILIVVLVTPVAATEAIGWEELIDQNAQAFDDPFVDLDYDQMDDLRMVAVETARIEQGGMSEEERAVREEKRDQARLRLADAGIDAEWLISQRWVVAERREKAATAVNPDLDGEVVTLGGFAIPAPPAADGTPIAYLVPLPGMCSHMPPPNPNQLVRIRLNTDWRPDRLHQPVRVTGLLSIKSTEHVFNIVDGPVEMRASLVMDATGFHVFEGFSSRSTAAPSLPHSASN